MSDLRANPFEGGGDDVTLFRNKQIKRSPKKRKAHQENTSQCRIIYQSDGNSETVDHAKGCDQPRNSANTISQIQSTVLVFGQVNIPSQVFIVLRAL